ncbi:MAG: hypothetical protein NXY57DRAFT_969971 [Lentinula lateritia]|nr:MAG: hypothetical protein NXY57DRAFT_969971 [Lentinula lateritia]
MALRTQFIALSSEEDRRVWINQKRKEYQEIEQHAHLEFKHKNNYSAPFRNNHIYNHYRILGRLEVIGWREEAQRMLRGTGFPTADALTGDWHPLFNQPRKLTERGKAASPVLILLSLNMTSRLEEHRTQAIRYTVKSQSCTSAV